MHHFIYIHTTLLIGYASLDGPEKISRPCVPFQRKEWLQEGAEKHAV